MKWIKLHLHKAAWMHLLILPVIASPLHAQGIISSRQTWITLGTASGPLPQAKRAQPGNLLMVGEQGILIDVGDGATQQLGKVGVTVPQIRAVFITHFHADHVGGLFAFLSRRYHLRVPGQVAIYGPPGTKATIQGMLAAMKPLVGAVEAIGGRTPVALEEMVSVTEIGDGWTGMVFDTTVTAATNSHYILQTDIQGGVKKDTFAFRFETDGRSYVYTGDTGPSEAVEKLAKNADVLLSEIMEPVSRLAELRQSNPDLSSVAMAGIEGHFQRQHLSPKEVGLLAQRSGAKRLVLTHNAINDSKLAAAKSDIAKNYKGPVIFAKDLDKF